MKKLIIVFLLMFVPSLAFSSEPPPPPNTDCPEGFVCVPDRVASSWRTILEHQQCMDNALDILEAEGSSSHLSLTFEDYPVIITKEGQVFDQETLVAVLEWCDYQIEFHTKPNLQVSIKEEDPNTEPTWGFRLRIRLGVNLHPLYIVGGGSSTALTEAVLLVEPFFIHHFHVAAYAGLQTFGVVGGMDLTSNLNLFLGVGAGYADPSPTPVLGLSLSFN